MVQKVLDFRVLNVYARIRKAYTHTRAYYYIRCCKVFNYQFITFISTVLRIKFVERIRVLVLVFFFYFTIVIIYIIRAKLSLKISNDIEKPRRITNKNNIADGYKESVSASYTCINLLH